jgi:hypothetical protein
MRVDLVDEGVANEPGVGDSSSPRIERPRSTIAWVGHSVLALWWIVVFRIAPEGDGFMATTWPSLLRMFGACLVAATVSVVCAAIEHRRTAIVDADGAGPISQRDVV